LRSANYAALAVSLSVGALAGHARGQSATQTPGAKHLPKYGSDPAVGKTFTHDGIRLYYEIYGSGEPLLLIHGNGASIGSFAAQIEYFRHHYRVIAMDSRDQGRSGDSTGKLTYEKMTDDQAALLHYLKSPPADVLGWSDGGIEALLLGVRHPAIVRKIASMAANLDPKDAYPEVIAMAKSQVDSIPANARQTAQGKRDLRVSQLVLDEPHIDPRLLEKIMAPTLVLASDHDLIMDEHTLQIYHHLPNSQLCIFPNATHMVPYDASGRIGSRTSSSHTRRWKSSSNRFAALTGLKKAGAA
jgi:pimeloyl-ACP methyl ester carboxylesterase